MKTPVKQYAIICRLVIDDVICIYIYIYSDQMLRQYRENVDDLASRQIIADILANNRIVLLCTYKCGILID